MKIVGPDEFQTRLYSCLDKYKGKVDYVTGPGRSGAIASSFASHYLGVPFVPYKCKIPNKVPLIVDTAIASGGTVRKASRVYNGANYVAPYNQPPRVKFWYETPSMKRGKGNEFPKD